MVELGRGKRMKNLGVVYLCVIASLCFAGENGYWVVPEFPADAKPYPPRRIFWMTVKNNPVVYRREFQLPEDFKAVAIHGGVREYLYVYTNRILVASYTPKRPVQRLLVHDITQACRPGKNVMAVSAASSGFWLGCYSHIAVGRRSAFFTDRNCKVMRFRPLTRIEDLDLNEPGFDTSSWYPVRGEEFDAPPPPVEQFR